MTSLNSKSWRALQSAADITHPLAALAVDRARHARLRLRDLTGAYIPAPGRRGTFALLFSNSAQPGFVTLVTADGLATGRVIP